VRPGQSVSFSVSFPSQRTFGTVNPPTPGTPGGGTPSISVSGGNMKLSGISGCGNSDSFSFTDNQSTAGARRWSTQSTSWPATVNFSVTNTGGACSAAGYNLNFSR
jgi:hypothetical protein